MSHDPTAPTQETQDQRLARQLASLREVTGFSLRLARQAALEAEPLPQEPTPVVQPRPNGVPDCRPSRHDRRALAKRLCGGHVKT
jgi:hypothetical protein